MPKPTRSGRPNLKRRREIARLWPIIRDQRKREMQNADGSWTCVYCKKPIWSWAECVPAHIQPKGRRPDLKLDPENVYPSHASCNTTSDPNYCPNPLC